MIDANPLVQAARAAFDASGARRDAAARPLYNPALSLDAEDTDTERTQTVGISQTIDWANKRGARADIGESGRQVAEAEYLATRWAVTVELLTGLAEYRTSVALDELAVERLRLMTEFADLAQRRFEAGDLSRVELETARIAAVDARIQKATAATALAEARQSVHNFTPSSPSGWPSLSPNLPAPPLDTDPEQLVKALPSVRAVQAQVDVADAIVELREREKRPDPTFSVVGGREGDDTLVGVNVSIPLYLRNRFSDEVAAALADRQKAEQIAMDAFQRAYARIVSAAERYRVVRDAWRAWERTGEESLARRGEQLRRMWEAGEISTTDYLVQFGQTLDVQENALDLRQSIWAAWFEWLGASGLVDAWLGLKAIN